VTGRQPAVRLRRATASDADLLLDWANDPVTRAASFHPDPIDRSGHVRWLAARVHRKVPRLNDLIPRSTLTTAASDLTCMSI